MDSMTTLNCGATRKQVLEENLHFFTHYRRDVYSNSAVLQASRLRKNAKNFLKLAYPSKFQ